MNEDDAHDVAVACGMVVAAVVAAVALVAWLVVVAVRVVSRWAR